LKVVIGIPCMETVPTGFLQSILEMDHPCETTFAITRSSLVYDARNEISAMAVNGGYDAVIWIDSDMTFDADIVTRFIEHYQQGRDYVSGLCFTRRTPTMPVVYKELDLKTSDGDVETVSKLIDDYPNEMFEVQGSGFAGVMTSVKMIKDIAIHHGPPFYPRYGFGEDLTFCYLAKKSGYKMYCDPSIKLGHIGNIVFAEESYKSQRRAK